MTCEGTTADPCVMVLDDASVAAVAVPLVLILVVCIALLVRSLK